MKLAQVKDVEQDPIEMGRQNGMTIIDRRSQEEQVKPVSVPRKLRTGDMHNFPAWCRENDLDPAQIIADKAKEVEGAAYNGNTEPLRNLHLWCMKRGLETTAIVSDQRIEELEAIAIRMAKKLKLLETTLPLEVEKAIIQAKGLGKPDPLLALFASITEEDKKSKKIKTMIFPANQVMRELFAPDWQKH
ncbi:MAG TPA: hypothetical protein P5080_05755 [Candidatus Paceibacterota bacterium]|nr:hypothetical protein [Candidatus Paceibacterota bacterium]HSA37172.1 hypothetical protein [Candidatus Paceibacterota bacterium]